MEQDVKKENYEVAFWIKTEVSDPVKAILAKNGAEATKERLIQKMRLAFPIKKENFAFLGTIIFSMPAEAIGNLKSELNMEPVILRYFLRKAKKPSEERRVETGVGSETSPNGRKSFFRKRSDASKAAGDLLTNEALEKKIEEILK